MTPKQVQQRVFALADVVQRKNHFSYEDAGQAETSELNEQLRQRLETNCSHNVMHQREQLRQKQSQFDTIQPSIYSIAKFLRQ